VSGADVVCLGPVSLPVTLINGLLFLLWLLACPRMRNSHLIALALALSFFSTSRLMSEEVESASPSAGDANGTVVVSLSGHFPLHPGGGMLFGDSGMSLFDATTTLRRALLAPERRVVIDCTLECHPGLAAAEEFAAIIRNKNDDKQVTCLIDNASEAVMAIAAACDDVAMIEAGMLVVDGLGVSADYYADALNRFGIKFHAVTSGAAKTAPEPFTHPRPSATAVAEYQRLISALDKAARELMVRKNFTLEQITQAYAQAPQTSAIAHQVQMIDSAVESGVFYANLPKPVRHLKPERNLPNLESFAGMMEFIQSIVKGEKQQKYPRAVAVVELEGTIIDGGASVPGYSIAGHDTADLFDDLIKDKSVIGVVVRLNSGGGSAGASDRIYHALKRLSEVKPTVALFDAVSASGGYYIGCGAREIFVHRGTITGSIGVFAMVPDLDAMRNLFGVNRFTYTTGPRTDMFSTNLFSADKEAAIRQVVKDVDDRFQAIVAERRNLSLDTVHTFSGDEAVANGLAQQIGTLITAVERVRAMAGINEPLPLIRLPQGGGLAQRLGLMGVASQLSSQLGALLPRGVLPLIQQTTARRLQVMAWYNPLNVE
jgi:protease IV